MTVKLFDSELKVMEALWREGEATAKRLSDVLKEQVGWNMNTTYTVIKRCIQKGAIERSEPHFLCRPLISREQARQAETDALIHKFYDSSADKLFAALLGRPQLNQEQIEKLKRMADQMEEE